MLRYHMAVITPDTRLRRAVKRVTTAAGATAEFVASHHELANDEPIHLAIIDARQPELALSTMPALPRKAAVACIVANDALTQSVSLFEDQRVHSILCHNEDLDDDEFIASANKALSGDVFGLEKYFPWGVATFSLVVSSYEQKSRAIEMILDYSRTAGLRGPVRDRIQLVADELMMNALYHAPVDEHGNELYGQMSRKELASMEEVQPINIRYGCSGRYFGLSVCDGGGSLTRTKALEYLKRAQRGIAEIEDKATGAGLGLVSVLHSASKLIFNIHPGTSTEVIALFDIERMTHGRVGAHSLHIFEAGKAGANRVDDDDEGALGRAKTQGSAGEDGDAEAAPVSGMIGSRWLMAALVLAVLLAGMAIGHSARSQRTQPVPALIVLPEPADATVRLDGTEIPAGRAVPLTGTGTHEVIVEKPGHSPWRTVLTPSPTTGTVQLDVALPPAR